VIAIDVPWGPPGTEEGRLYMRKYMAARRAGRRVRRRPRDLRPHFNRPGHCENCGHRWPTGGRCPLCALESIPARHLSWRFRIRRWIAWSQLMEALAAPSTLEAA